MASCMFAAHTCDSFINLKNGPKYRMADHLSYVNPHAPIGGKLRLSSVGSFNHFNPYSHKGVLASGSGLLYESLLAKTQDDMYTWYGLLAEKICIDYESKKVIWHLRPDIYFHRGEQLSVKDVVHSLEMIKKSKLFAMRELIRPVKSWQVVDELTLAMTVDPFDLTIITQIGSLPILPLAGESLVNANKSILPYGTGPYILKEVVSGRRIGFVRHSNYWGKDHFLSKGRYRFSEIDVSYFLSDHTAFMSFLAGKIDIWQESISKRWQNGYKQEDHSHWIKKCIPSQRHPGVQGFVFNMRKPELQEPLIRSLMIKAFDFKWFNEAMFYNQYKPLRSFFTGTEYEAAVKPTDAEIKLASRLPNPLSESELMIQEPPSIESIKQKLLAKGYVWDSGQLYSPQGQAIRLTIPYWDSAYQRVLIAYRAMLKRVGITLDIHLLPTPDYIHVLRNHNYDLVWTSFQNDSVPNRDLYLRWHSSGAKNPSLINLAGTHDKNIDWLVMDSSSLDRREHQTRVKLLDRLLRQHRLIIPHWYLGCERFSYNKSLSYHKSPLYGADIFSWYFP